MGLEESKLCDTVGYVAIPECVANNGGDECVARKTSELIRKTLRAAMKAEKIKQLPSGEKFFATCKHIGYKNVLKTIKRKRRSDKDDDDVDRKRRSIDCVKTPKHPECKRRKRRSNENCDNDDVSCRQRREACKACEDNPDSTLCAEC